MIYGGLIRSVGRKAGLNESESEDALQEVLIAIVKHIKNFKYDPARCSFKSWLLLITRQRIIWQLRRRPKVTLPEQDCPPGFQVAARPPRELERDQGPGTDTVARVTDPSGDALSEIWETEWRGNILAAALELTKQEVNPRQFQIFDLNVRQGWTAREVARMLKVSTAQVYMAKHRVAAVLRKSAKKIQKRIDG